MVEQEAQLTAFSAEELDRTMMSLQNLPERKYVGIVEPRNQYVYNVAKQHRVLQKLTPLVVEVLDLRYAQDSMSLREIGERIGKSATTVSKIEKRGLRILRKYAKEIAT